MRKQTATLVFFCFFGLTTALAQPSSLKGTITDTLNKQNLTNAVISLLSIKDSVLAKFTRADSRGNFELRNLSNEKYIIMVTYPGYVDMMDTVLLKPNISRDLGAIILTTKAHLLQEVIVRQTIAPIRIKGDTTEYLADSFKVKPGATVEDLLKIMPGITVNSKGEITTQGQKVQKVLVDGDEFFGDDPTMATQNLNAKDIAKVQVFDKKSDQSVLTGIDDGTKQKTVNLIMKDDAKKGYFGKVEGGTDFNKYYQAKATANRFTSTLKAGALLTADRTGRNGMNWEEMQDFGNITTIVDGGNVMMYSEGDEFSSYNTQGIPENLQGALVINKKFGKLKNNTTNNYTYNHQNLVGDGYTATKYILPDTLYYNNQSSTNNSTKWKQNFSTKNEFNIDSTTTITINARTSWGKSNQYSTFNSEYLTGSKSRVNKSNRSTFNVTDNNNNKADIFIKRKLNKSGTRSLTISGGLSNNTSNSDGYLTNETDFYSNGNPATAQFIDQRKTSNNTSVNTQALVSYVEPISKKVSLNINYTFNTNTSEQDTRSFEKRNGKYDSLNLLYSNHYKFVNTSHREGFSLNYTNKKITTKLGLAIQYLTLGQTNIYKDSGYNRNFTNFFPNASLRWKFSTSGNININYNGSTQQPSLSQLQPILNNIDPLNVAIGNPSLKPAFNHVININMGDFKVLTKRNIWGYGSFSLNQNAFSTKSVVDNMGRKTYQTVNVDGNYNYYAGISYGRQIKLMNLDISFNPRFNGSRNVNFVNGIENITKSYTIGPGLRVGKSIEKKLYLDLSYSPSFSHSESSINPAALTEYWVHRVGMNLNYTFLKGLSLNSDIDANFRQKLSPSDKNNNAVIWNASLEKSIWKKKDLTAILTVNDILNQNIGFSRDITSNYVSENTYATVQRYVLLSLRWKFNKNRKTTEN